VTTSPIALLCALDVELAHARAPLEAGPVEWNGPRAAAIGRCGETPVVLAVCGLGMLSAAAVTEWVIGRYRPRAVVNYGCAGAHRDELLPGDLVIGERVVYYGSLRESRDGTIQYAGIRYLDRGEPRRADALHADPDLLAAAGRAAAVLEGRHEHWPPDLAWPEGVVHRPPRVERGTVASADGWNRTRPSIERLVGRHGSHCEDMEAAAIAATCASHGVPFLSIKDISNNELLRATDSGVAMLAEVGEAQLARRAAALAVETIRQLCGPGASR
jgi:adenosylhomocysteine nucleosidase